MIHHAVSQRFDELEHLIATLVGRIEALEVVVAEQRLELDALAEAVRGIRIEMARRFPAAGIRA
jgi:uncharacterized coiled-coil protein SlyX